MRPAPAAELLPVTITDLPAAPVPASPPSPVPVGTIQLQLPRARLRIGLKKIRGGGGLVNNFGSVTTRFKSTDALLSISTRLRKRAYEAIAQHGHRPAVHRIIQQLK